MNVAANPIVTVITITRNRSVLLPRAIKSVLSQSHKEIDYVIIDGASDDNTEEVVRSFNDPRINYIKLAENLNHPDSYDLAFKKSKGKYITFLDDDDEYMPAKIEKQVNLLSSLPAEYGFVYCWMDYFDDQTGLKIREWHPKTKGNAYYVQIETQALGGTPTLFIRREAFERIGGLNKTLRHVADWEFNTRLSRYYLTDFVPEVLVRVHTNHGFQRMQTQKQTFDKIEALIEFHEYYLKEFVDGFERYPKKKIPHLKALSALNFKNNHFRRGIDYFYQFLKSKPKLNLAFRTLVKNLQVIFLNRISIDE